MYFKNKSWETYWIFAIIKPSCSSNVALTAAMGWGCSLSLATCCCRRHRPPITLTIKCDQRRVWRLKCEGRFLRWLARHQAQESHPRLASHQAGRENMTWKSILYCHGTASICTWLQQLKFWLIMIRNVNKTVSIVKSFNIIL